MDLSTTKPVVEELEFVKETKRTEVFADDADDAAVSQIYVSKDALARLGNPKAIRITIEAAQ